MHRRRPIAVLLVALALALGACGGGDGDDDAGGGDESADEGTDEGPAGPPPAATVVLKNLRFLPEGTTVKVGETVLWKWDDGAVQHDVKGDGWGSKLKTKGTFRHTFAEAGSFDYICTVHPTTMKATVEVT